mmetsp:Transcript_14333/g.39321  ORF Transcript_14333/g.39321 Transcript_14333/m.39321 type:complete len:210 (+) Transcript_14333:229-858(+)
MLGVEWQQEVHHQVASTPRHHCSEVYCGLIALQARLEPTAKLPSSLLEVALEAHPDVQRHAIEADAASCHVAELFKHVSPVEHCALKVRAIPADVVSADLREAERVLEEHSLGRTCLGAADAPLADVGPRIQDCASTMGNEPGHLSSQGLHTVVPVPGDAVVHVDLEGQRRLLDEHPRGGAPHEARGELGAVLGPLLLLRHHPMHCKLL